MSNSVARANKDYAKDLIITGANTVFINDLPAAFVTSAVAGRGKKGGVIIASPATSVYVEDKQIAVVGAITSKSNTVSTGSPDVFAG